MRIDLKNIFVQISRNHGRKPTMNSDIVLCRGKSPRT